MEATERDDLILSFMPLVKKISFTVIYKVFKNGTNIDQDDLVSCGTVGLIDAIDRFDRSKGVPLQAWVQLRVRGSMIDSVRTREYRRLNHYWPNEWLDPVNPYDPHQLACENEKCDTLNKAVECLSEKEQEVVRLFYGEDMRQEEIAVEMHRTRGRISQLHSAARSKLRDALQSSTT